MSPTLVKRFWLELELELELEHMCQARFGEKTFQLIVLQHH
jgi:hypothetical protein